MWNIFRKCSINCGFIHWNSYEREIQPCKENYILIATKGGAVYPVLYKDESSLEQYEDIVAWAYMPEYRKAR